MNKILFIDTGMAPYMVEDAMSINARALTLASHSAGMEVRTFHPKWPIINERRLQLHEVIRLSGKIIDIDDSDNPLLIKVASLPGTRAQIYFIDNDDLMGKRRPSDMTPEIPSLMGKRAVFYARGVIETVIKLNWHPDIIVCQGWAASVMPYYLKTELIDDPCFKDAKVISIMFPNEPFHGLGKVPLDVPVHVLKGFHHCP